MKQVTVVPYPVEKNCLSAPCQKLIELMQKINHGQIENLLIENGEPKWNPFPRIRRRISLIGKENGSRPEREKINFALKSSVRELFSHMRTLDDTAMVSIVIQNGLPMYMEIEENPSS